MKKIENLSQENRNEEGSPATGRTYCCIVPAVQKQTCRLQESCWVLPQAPQPTRPSLERATQCFTFYGERNYFFFKEWKPPAAWPLILQEVQMNWKFLPYWLPGPWTPWMALTQAQAIQSLLQPCLRVSVGCYTSGKITPTVQELMVIFQFTLLGRNNGAMRRQWVNPWRCQQNL